MHTNTRLSLVFSGLLLTLVALLSACGWESRGLDLIEEMYPTPVEDEDGDEEIPDDDIGDVEGEGLAGTWAMMVKLDGEMAPIIEVWGIELTGLYLAEFNEDETQLTLTFCDQISEVTTPKGKSDFGRTEIPDALKEALGERPVSVSLPGDGTLPARKVVLLWGLELDDPAGEDISDITPEDTRVDDWDKDDNPGITISVMQPQGERYMVQRAIWNIDAATMSEDKQYLDGTLSFSLEEIALGANPSLLATVAPITEKEAGNSRYSLRRLTGVVADLPADGDGDEADETDETPAARLLEDAFTCEDLITGWRAIFKDR